MAMGKGLIPIGIIDGEHIMLDVLEAILFFVFVDVIIIHAPCILDFGWRHVG